MDPIFPEIPKQYEIDEIELKLTCRIWPEQYDAFKNGVQVGYLRLRHGGFSVDCPDHTGANIFYSEEMEGDGEFLDQDERDRFLRLAVKKINAWIRFQEMTDFDRWWFTEGSKPPAVGDDIETHCKKMCSIAWENGAYKEKNPTTGVIVNIASDSPYLLRQIAGLRDPSEGYVSAQAIYRLRESHS